VNHPDTDGPAQLARVREVVSRAGHAAFGRTTGATDAGLVVVISEDAELRDRLGALIAEHQANGSGKAAPGVAEPER
jgi:beta-galactosidase GanA